MKRRGREREKREGNPAMSENRKRYRLLLGAIVRPIGQPAYAYIYRVHRPILAAATGYKATPRRAPHDNDLFNYMRGFAQV